MMRRKSEGTTFFELDIDNPPRLTPKQKAELEALAAMPEGAIDYSDIPPIEDFGGFRRAGTKQKAPRTLLEWLKEEKEVRLSGRIYHKVQVDFTYHSNHMEGCRLTHEQTALMYKTNTVACDEGCAVLRVDDIVETANHFCCIDWVIDNAKRPLAEKDILLLHAMLKQGTSDSRKSWFKVGAYKLLANEVGGRKTTAPERVAEEMAELLSWYEGMSDGLPSRTFRDLLDFHVRFERIHPFQDGNGRVGRLILFKECLRHDIVPFIMEDDLALFYYRGLNEWDELPGYLMDTCLTAQDRFRKVLDSLGIRY